MKSMFFAIVVVWSLLFGCSRHEVHRTLPEQADRPKTVHKLPAGPEKMFPDYRPKTSSDGLLDYRPGLAERISSFPKFRLEYLPELLSGFRKFNDEAKKTPGQFREGNVILGADQKEYVPSDAELLAAYLGDGLKGLLDSSPSDQVIELMKAKGISGGDISFVRFEFRHVDVMGSGRFFYCSKPKAAKLTLSKIP